MAALTYAPSEVVLTVCGYIITGIVSVEVSWNTETFKMVKGIRGKNTRVQNLDTSATMTLELLQVSTSNDVFTQLFAADQTTQSSRLQISLKDNSGRTEISSSEAYISSLPRVGFTNDFSNRIWTIHMLETTATVGGNAKQLPDLFNTIGEGFGKVVDNITGYANKAIDSAGSFFD